MPIESSREPRSFGEFEHEGWESVSSGYERHFAPLTRQSVPALLDAACVKKGVSVLDVCCGPGVVSAEAARRGARVVGVDFSAAFLALARANVPGVRFQQGDAQALDFDDDTFDAVVCGFGLIHLPDPARALAEYRRVVRKGGYVAVSTWQMATPDNGFGVIYGAIREHGTLDVSLPHGPDFFQFSPPERMRAALVEAGLNQVELVDAGQIWHLELRDGILRAFLEGAVRARGLLQGQSAEQLERIRSAILSGMDRFATAEGVYRVPTPALIGVGRK